MRSLRLLSLLLLAGASTVSAQRSSSATSEPCCGITAINARGGIVTARERSTGKTFRFEVKDRALLKTLTVGQPVWADFAAKQVSVKQAGPVNDAVDRAGSAAGTIDVNPIEPCCGILPEVRP